MAGEYRAGREAGEPFPARYRNRLTQVHLALSKALAVLSTTST